MIHDGDAPIADEARPSRAGLVATAQAALIEERWLDAIEPLTLAHRMRPSPKLDAQLLTARHRAFTELSSDVPPPSGLPVWPWAVADRFSGTDGVPEIEPAGLTADAVAAGIVHHGSLLVRGLFGHHTVARLVDDIDRAFAGFAADAGGAPRSETAPWFVPFRPDPAYEFDAGGRNFVVTNGGVWTVDSPRAMFDLTEAFHEVGIDGVIAEYLGERPVMSAKKATLRRVADDGGGDWHQDGAFLGTGLRSVNVWLALSHCGGGTGCPGLEVVPQRIAEIAPTGTEGAWFDWSVGSGVVDRLAGTDGVSRPEFFPGDVLLLDDWNLHRTAPAPSVDQPRYAIETWFFAPSCYPPTQVPVVL